MDYLLHRDSWSKTIVELYLEIKVIGLTMYTASRHYQSYYLWVIYPPQKDVGCTLPSIGGLAWKAESDPNNLY